MKLKKIRDALLVMLTLALVSATAVAVTWALVDAKMGTLENTFSSPNTSIDLREDRWNGRGFSDDMTGDPEVKLPANNASLPYSDNTTKTSWSNSDFGFTKAQNYSTDMVIPKNPGIKNTTMLSKDGTKPLKDADDGKVWVGMTVDYLLKLGTYNTTKANVNYAVYTQQSVPTYMRKNGTTPYYWKGAGDVDNTSGADLASSENWTTEENDASVVKTTVYAPITAIPGTASDLIGSYGSIKTFNNSPYYSYATRKDFEDSIATLKSDVAGGTAATYKNYTGDYAASGEGKYQEVAKVSENTTAGQWVSNNPDVDKVFYYTKRLAVNDSNEIVDADGSANVNISQPLFNSVKINHSFAQSDSNLAVATRDENNDIVRDGDGKVVTTSKKLYQIELDDFSNGGSANDGTKLYFDGLPEFEIKMQGYAVQGQGVNWKDSNTFTAASEINNLIVAHDSSYLAPGSAATNGKTVLSAATVS